MTHKITQQAQILRALVESAGGPAEFARTYSQPSADKPIDPSYVSQILNGHRAFGERARRKMAIRAGLAEEYFELKQIASYPTNGMVASEPNQPVKPRIDTLIRKLQLLEESHPAVQAVEWALRDVPAIRQQSEVQREPIKQNDGRMDEKRMQFLIDEIGKNGNKLKLHKNND